jgi:hypothetical protein
MILILQSILKRFYLIFHNTFSVGRSGRVMDSSIVRKENERIILSWDEAITMGCDREF